MSSRTSRRIARAIRQTKKGAKLGRSLAKTAVSAAELGFTSGGVVALRSPIVAAAIASPATANTNELQRMGVEKSVAAFSASANLFSNLLSAQLTWMRFGFAQARLGGAAFDRIVRARATPMAAGQVVAETAQRSVSNTVDAVTSLSQSTQLFLQQALRPFQKAVSANAVRLARR